ncbi:hypothetical protein BJY24_007689 [Nocardia transvalensis]|uniref:Uncharacterized protein n=1 Tax=Nocardia transvalensis TaxID=37333 RepID=A0A7W9PMI6_9NOCA|nr:hypothetical protein [Nocardia transvalensis]MBB5918777.1 hypothetical protein [Nocardia transvalensis]
MEILFLATIVNIVVIVLISKLSNSLDDGSDNIANRIALASQGTGGGGGGGGGGHALGMGQIGANRGMSPLSVFADASTIAGSPLTEWAMLGIPGSFHPQAKLKRDLQRMQAQPWLNEPRMPTIQHSQGLKWAQIGRNYARDANNYGGIDTVRGAAAGVTGTLDAGGFISDVVGAHRMAGGRNEKQAAIAGRSFEIVQKMAKNQPFKDDDLSFIAAAVGRAHDQTISFLNRDTFQGGYGGIDEDELAADYATMRQGARLFRRFRPGGIPLDGGTGHGAQTDFVTRYMDRSVSDQEKDRMIHVLNHMANGGSAGGLEVEGDARETARRRALYGRMRINNIGADEASDMRLWIRNEHAKQMLEKIDGRNGFLRDVSDEHRLLAVREELNESIKTQNRFEGEEGASAPRMSVTLQDVHHPNWATGLGDIQRMLDA